MDGRLWQGRVNLLRPWLKRRFGRPTAKIGLDAGFSCPNRDGSLGKGGCSYCPPGGSGSGKGGQDLAGQLQEGLGRLAQKARRQGRELPAVLAYFQAYTSTHAPARLMAAQYEAALAAEGAGGLGIDGVIVSTRPDCLDAARWDVLSDLNRKSFMWLELGLQSAHDETLRRINRGHDAACFKDAVLQAHGRGIKVVAHVILGLPGETLAHTNQTAGFLAGLPIWGVKLHNLMVLAGSNLAFQALEGGFTPWPLETWLEAASGFLARLPEKVLIHRLAADAGREQLIMPKWAGNKDAALTALARHLNDHDISQGDLCRN